MSLKTYFLRFMNLLQEKPYEDGTISKNKYFGPAEASILREACQSVCPDETLMYEMQRSLLDIEVEAAAISNKRNVIQNFEQEIKKRFIEMRLMQLILRRNVRKKIAGMQEAFDDENWTE